MKTHSKGSAYSKEDAYWKEGTRVNHHGNVSLTL